MKEKNNNDTIQLKQMYSLLKINKTTKRKTGKTTPRKKNKRTLTQHVQKQKSLAIMTK